jgi:NAD(P)-dependent dehydrogenase (short-subunit alcohol dehydrogenase family)
MYFKDKVVVVTGSGVGIGRTVALLLAQHGACVVINGRDEKKLETALALFPSGSKVLAVAGDVSVPGQAEMLIERTVAQFGRLDAIINNAGVSLNADFADTKPEIFKKVIDANILGSVYPSMYALKHLEKTKGSIVFISSVAGLYGLPKSSAYSVSKMALTALSQSLRMEVKEKNIHIGIVYVGFTENDPEKRVLNASGELIEVAVRPAWLQMTQLQTATAILKNIECRKKSTVLTVVGKINFIMTKLFPFITERVVMNSMKRMKNMYSNK